MNRKSKKDILNKYINTPAIFVKRPTIKCVVNNKTIYGNIVHINVDNVIVQDMMEFNYPVNLNEISLI